jgi:hypothetical protein
LAAQGLLDGLRSRMDERRVTEVNVAVHVLNRMLELGGSVRDRASKYNLFFRIDIGGRSCGFQDGQDSYRAAEELESAAVGGNRLVLAGEGAEKVAKLIITPAEPGGRSGALEAPHRPVSAFDAPMILLEPVIQVGIGSVPHILAQFGADRPRVAVMAIGCDPSGDHPPVTVLAERKNALAAAMSRCSLNITSTKAPERSIAR